MCSIIQLLNHSRNKMIKTQKPWQHNSLQSCQNKVRGSNKLLWCFQSGWGLYQIELLSRRIDWCSDCKIQEHSSYGISMRAVQRLPTSLFYVLGQDTSNTSPLPQYQVMPRCHEPTAIFLHDVQYLSKLTIQYNSHSATSADTRTPISLTCTKKRRCMSPTISYHQEKKRG